jgi:hypothetical protein
MFLYSLRPETASKIGQQRAQGPGTKGTPLEKTLVRDFVNIESKANKILAMHGTLMIGIFEGILRRH